MLIKDLLQYSSKLPLTRSSWSIKHGIEHLIQVDENFIPLFEEFGISERFVAFLGPEFKADAFRTLLKTIVCQQVSDKSAMSIFARFMDACVGGEEKLIQPHHVLESRFETIIIDNKNKVTINGKVSGLSTSKAAYIQDLARHFNDENLLKNLDFHSVSEEVIYDKLIAVKGLGPWSVHMFMLHHVQKSDVLPIGDLGVRRGLCHFFGYPLNYFETKPHQMEISKLCSSWSPYSSLASLLMWSLSGKLLSKSSSSLSSTNSKLNTKETIVEIKGISTSEAVSSTIKNGHNVASKIKSNSGIESVRVSARISSNQSPDNSKTESKKRKQHYDIEKKM